MSKEQVSALCSTRNSTCLLQFWKAVSL